MTFDSGKKIVAFRFLSLVSTALFVVYMLLAYFDGILGRVVPSSTLTLMTIAIVFLYLLTILWPLLRKYKYIYFTNDGKSIILRWYSIGLILGESKSIEIPKESFAGCEITQKLWGFYKYITLYQIFQNHRAAYPPVAITSLSSKQIRIITEALECYK